MIKLQKSGIFLAFLTIILVFIIFFSPKIFEEKGRINAGVIFAGSYYDLSDNNIFFNKQYITFLAHLNIHFSFDDCLFL